MIFFHFGALLYRGNRVSPLASLTWNCLDSRMPRFFSVLCLLSLLVSTPMLRAELHLHRSWELCACKSHLGKRFPFDPDAAHTGNGRQYAPDRVIDVKHVLLDLTPDFVKRNLAGAATLTSSPIAKPLRQLRLDAIDLQVSKVESSAPIEAWDAGKKAITITFADPVPVDAETTVTVTYSAHPEGGWYYRTAAMGYPQGDDHFWPRANHRPIVTGSRAMIIPTNVSPAK